MNEQNDQQHWLSNSMAQACLDQAPIAIFQVDPAGRILEGNHQACQSLGYTQEELLSKTIFEIDPNLTTELWQGHRRDVYTKQTQTVESKHKRKDGSTFPVEVTVIYFGFQGKEITYSFVRDITERKLLEEITRKRNFQEKEAMRIANMGTWEYTFATGCFCLNDQYYSLHGTTTLEAGGNEIQVEDFLQKYIPPEERQTLAEGIRMGVETQDPGYQFQTESRIFRVDGSIRDVMVWLGIEKDDQNRTVRIFGITQDITEQKTAKEALKKSNDLLKIIIDTAPAAIIGLDPGGKVSTVWNQGAERMFGWTANEVMGRYLPTVPPEKDEDFQQNLARMRNRESLQGIEAHRVKRDGTAIDYSVYTSPMLDKNNQQTGSIAVFVDLTARKKVEASLRLVNRQLRMLSDCNQALIRASEEDELLATICQIAVQIGGYSMAWVGLALDDPAKTVQPVAYYGLESGYLANANVSWADNARGRGPMGTAIRTGNPCPVQNILADPRFSPWREEAALRGYAAVCGLPLIAGGRTLGALGIYSAAADAFDTDEVRLLSELAGDLAMGIMMLRTRIERKRAEEALKQSDFFLRKSQAVATIGSYYFDVLSGKWISSDALDDLFGIDQRFEKDVSHWISLIHPDEQEEMRRYLTEYVVLQHNRFDLEYRIIRQDNGQERWVHGLGELELDDLGNTVKMIGTIQDITPRKKTEIFLQTLNKAALAMQKARLPNEIYTIVAGELNKIGFTCAFFSIDATKENLIPVYLSYPNMKIAEKLTGLKALKLKLPIRKIDVFRETVKERKTIYLSSLKETAAQIVPKRFSALVDTIMQFLRVTKTINAPLIAEGEVMGMFTLQSDDLHSNDIPSVTAFAHQMAAAWRQLQLYEQAQQEIVARREAETQIRNLNEALEHRVKTRTAQLQIANEELEAFAYSVSHDLRAPLRAINGYSQILAEDYAAVLDDEGKRVCGIISKEAQRMGQLIDDLLAFSRLSRAEMQVFPVDMHALVRAIFTEIATAEEQKRIQFLLAPLPQVLADPGLIRQVWVNLVSNAIKFTKKRELAIIEIGFTPAENEITFWVKDNGAGFDMRYSSNLFGVFRRLHSEKEFEGTGVGLAIVQRVIKRHGGRVWATGEVDQGATFFFSLPEKGRP
jgi:PAS domain S-box-containing protein